MHHLISNILFILLLQSSSHFEPSLTVLFLLFLKNYYENKNILLFSMRISMRTSFIFSLNISIIISSYYSASIHHIIFLLSKLVIISITDEQYKCFTNTWHVVKWVFLQYLKTTPKKKKFFFLILNILFKIPCESLVFFN